MPLGLEEFGDAVLYFYICTKDCVWSTCRGRIHGYYCCSVYAVISGETQPVGAVGVYGCPDMNARVGVLTTILGTVLDYFRMWTVDTRSTAIDTINRHDSRIIGHRQHRMLFVDAWGIVSFISDVEHLTRSASHVEECIPCIPLEIDNKYPVIDAIDRAQRARHNGKDIRDGERSRTAKLTLAKKGGHRDSTIA